MKVFVQIWEQLGNPLGKIESSSIEISKKLSLIKTWLERPLQSQYDV